MMEVAMKQVSASDERPKRLRALFDRIGALPDAGLNAMEAHLAIVDLACANLDTPLMLGQWALTGTKVLEHLPKVYDRLARGSTFQVPQRGPDFVTPEVMAMLEKHRARWVKPQMASDASVLDPVDQDLADETALRHAVADGVPFRLSGSDLWLQDGRAMIPFGAIITPIPGRSPIAARVSLIFAGRAGLRDKEIEFHDAPEPANV